MMTMKMKILTMTEEDDEVDDEEEDDDGGDDDDNEEDGEDENDESFVSLQEHDESGGMKGKERMIIQMSKGK